jgi:hypothetical protein
MEQQLRQRGVTLAVLDSTETALAFYWQASCSPTGACGASGCRAMQKSLLKRVAFNLPHILLP